MTEQPLSVVPELTLPLRLELARRHAGYTQRTLAEAMGLSLKTIQTSESGVRPIKRANVLAWAMATGVSLQWIEHGTTPGGPDTPTAPGEDAEGRNLRARRDSNSQPSDLVSVLRAAS